MRIHLEAAGYLSEEAKDGGEAWRKLQTEPFDLLITDDFMPELDGYQLVRLMESEASTSRLPVLFVHGKYADSNGSQAVLNIQKSRASGRIICISKPYHPINEIVVAVKSFIG